MCLDVALLGNLLPEDVPALPGPLPQLAILLLMLVLAPLLLGLGIEVRYHGTFLARLAFTLI